MFAIALILLVVVSILTMLRKKERRYCKGKVKLID